jgi:hypothetical protein
MHKNPDGLQLSATDVVNHVACSHLTELDLTHLDTPLDLGEQDPTLELLARKGDDWERTYRRRLHDLHGEVIEIPRNLTDRAAVEATNDSTPRQATILAWLQR